MTKRFKIFIIISIIIFCGILLWEFNIRVAIADYYFLKTRQFNNWETSPKNYQKVFKYFPEDPYYNKKFAIDLLWSVDKFYSSEKSKIKILDLGIKRMESIPKYERVFEVTTYLARLYMEKAHLTKNQKDFQLAEKKIKKAASMAPKMAGVYNDWCQLKIYQRDWQQAKNKCQKALSLYPDLDSPGLNQEHRQMIEAEMSQVYEKLGIIFREKNKYGVAEQMYVQILKFFPLQKRYIWKKIADLYYLQNDLDQAIKNNLHGSILNPKDPVWAKSLSILYGKKGDKDKSQFWSQKAKKLEQNQDNKN